MLLGDDTRHGSLLAALVHYSMSGKTTLTWFRYTLASRDITRFSIFTVGVTLTSLCMNTINDFSLSITIYMK